MNKKILCVDDEPNVLTAYTRFLQKGFDVETATSGEDALRLLDQDGPFAVVVADYQMPGMNGLELLSQAQQFHPETVRILITGHGELDLAITAVNQNSVFQFLTKPCNSGTLLESINLGCRQYQLEIADREIKQQTLQEILKVMSDVLQMTDPETFRMCHSIQDHVRLYCALEKIPDAWQVETAAAFSLIGVVTLPPGLAAKANSNASLSKEERELWDSVPETGARLLESLPRLEKAAEIVRHQNKNLDGTGTPEAVELTPEQVPLGSKIIRVFNRMIQLELKKMPRHEALNELKKFPDFYDSKIVDQALFMFKANLKSMGLPEGSHIVQRNASELREGDLLMADAMTNEDMVVATAGMKLTETALEKIRNFSENGGIREPLFVTENARSIEEPATD